MAHQPNLFAQGDILLQRIDAYEPSKIARPAVRDEDGALVIGRGELSGHRHIVIGEATLYTEPEFARSLAAHENYVGHLTIANDAAVVRHEEHDQILLPPGTSYIVRRQRVFNPSASIRRTMLAGD